MALAEVKATEHLVSEFDIRIYGGVQGSREQTINKFKRKKSPSKLIKANFCRPPVLPINKMGKDIRRNEINTHIKRREGAAHRMQNLLRS